MTGLPDLTKQEYIHRVVFGAWIGDRIIQSFYDENEQVLINYEY